MKSYTQMTLSGFDKKALLSALLAAGMVMGSTGVSALTATGDMTVSATLTSACSVSASTLDFGSIAALNVTADVTGDTGSTLEIACTTGTTTPVIYSTSTRTMTDGGLGSLAFFLSQTSGAAADDLPNTSTGEAIGGTWTANGAAQAVTIYGRIPTSSFAGQPVGSYTATITISVDYL
ncbi:spore coat protein U domain-containing protein [Methylomarinum sp. Ch1-1]|uniref:Spore coat protein U domain-containing protein n=1 Tax=Methylomarinum roseum TaxID=3067653 RepID=A0AAU7NTI2_9GAMM